MIDTVTHDEQEPNPCSRKRVLVVHGPSSTKWPCHRRKDGPVHPRPAPGIMSTRLKGQISSITLNSTSITKLVAVRGNRDHNHP